MKMRNLIIALLLLMLIACNLAGAGTNPQAVATSASQSPSPQAAVSLPSIHYTLTAPVTFATHTELAGYGFLWGPSDGAFGAIPSGGNSYTFYGTAGSSSTCAGTPKVNGTFSFTGTLDHVTGSNCMRLFGPGDEPAGYTFDRDYAGGGQVVRFAGEGTNGWLMSFHSEFHWKNMQNPPGYKCTVGKNSSSEVPCFYSSIGLALSLDNGKTFKVVGQIVQPAQPLSAFQGSANNMDIGYGTLIVADGNGKHLDNPPPNPGLAYFYVFFSDSLPGSPGMCASSHCMAVARAPYLDVIAAALSGDPRKVAAMFHKYDGASPNPWTQPATAWDQGSATPDLSGTAGKFAPLWTDQGAYEPQVIYDRSFDVYLAIYPWGGGTNVRASSDLIHWSEPIGPRISEPGRALIYPTLIGETGDPTIGGNAPRVYFSSFMGSSFPDYSQSVFESVQLLLARGP